MRSVKIHRPEKQGRAPHPAAVQRARKDKDEALLQAEGLVQDAQDQGRPVPDLEDVVARIEQLSAHCNPKHPHQRVMLFLVDAYPYFRATTAAVSEREEDAEA